MAIDQTTIETPPRERKVKRWPWIVGIIAAFIVGIGIGAAGAGDDTEPATTDNSAEISQLESQIADLEAERDEALGALSEQEAALGDQEAALAEREAQLDEREAQLDEREAQLDEREAAVTEAEETVAANTVTDGIWTVGVDIEAGTYRATDVSADCYWAVLVSGTNGAEIVNNGIPGGGSPQVTVSEGQDFETARCGEWVKQ